MSSSEGAPQNSANVWTKAERLTILICNMSGSVFACVCCFTRCPCACVELCYPHAPACPSVIAGVLLSCCLELICRAGVVFIQTYYLTSVCVEGVGDRHPSVCLSCCSSTFRMQCVNPEISFKKGGKPFRDVTLADSSCRSPHVGDGEMESCGCVVLLWLNVYASKSWISTGCGLVWSRANLRPCQPRRTPSLPQRKMGKQVNGGQQLASRWQNPMQGDHPSVQISDSLSPRLSLTRALHKHTKEPRVLCTHDPP